MIIQGLYHTPFLAAEWMTYCTVVEELNEEHCDDVIALWNGIQDRTPLQSRIA